MGSVNIIDPSGEAVAVAGKREIAPGRGDLRHSSLPATQWFNQNGWRGGLEMIGGRTVSHARLVAEQTWIRAAVMRLLTWSARVPLKAYQRVDDENRRRVGPRDHALARAVVDPWQGGSQVQLVQQLFAPVLVHGYSVTGVEEGAAGAIRFDDLDSRTVVPILSGWRRIAGWQVREDGEEREISADNAVHCSWWSPLGPVGTSPLKALGTTVRIEDAAQRYQQSIFRNGARPPSAIEADTEFLGLDRDDRAALLEQLREDVDSLYASPDNGGRPALLPPGLKWNAVGHSAVEAELIKQRVVAREEVCGVYMLMPGTLGIFTQGMPSLDEQRQFSYVDALAPQLIMIEQALNAQLVRNLLRLGDEYYVEFDFAGILRGDRLKEIQALREAIASALLAPNEGRRVLNLPTSEQEGMDDFYLPRNNLWPLRVPYPDQPGGAADPAPAGGAD